MSGQYDAGSRFAVPLPDGGYAGGLILERRAKRVAVRVFPHVFATVPSAAQMGLGDAPVWEGVVSDDALHECRWPVLSRPARHAVAAPGGAPIASARLERAVAARLAGGSDAPARTSVYAPADDEPFAPPQRNDRAWLALRGTIAPARDADVARWLAATPHAALRLRGEGARTALARGQAWNASRLAIEGRCVAPGLPAMPRVRALWLDGAPASWEALGAAFPGLRLLHVRAHGLPLGTRAIPPFRELERLSLGGAAGETMPSLTALPSLRVLEVYRSPFARLEPLLDGCRLQALRVDGNPLLRSIAPLEDQRDLRTLALSATTHVDDLTPLVRMPQLESLELAGLWQLDVAGVACVLDLPSLRRLRLDIGGRRKNAELYRRRPLAAPFPFDELLDGEDATT